MSEILLYMKEKFLVPSLVAGSIGGAGWMTQIHFTTLTMVDSVQALTKSVSEMAKKYEERESKLSDYKLELQKDYLKAVGAVEKELAEIKGEIKHLRKER